jgi:hypothetical protein
MLSSFILGLIMHILNNGKDFLAWKNKTVSDGDVCTEPSEYPVFVYEQVQSWQNQTSCFRFISVAELNNMLHAINNGHAFANGARVSLEDPLSPQYLFQGKKIVVKDGQLDMDQNIVVTVDGFGDQLWPANKVLTI